MQDRQQWLKYSVAAVLLAMMAGCNPTSDVSAGASAASAVTAVPTSFGVSGNVNGGYQPVIGATVSLYRVGSASGSATLMGQAVTDDSGLFDIQVLGTCPSSAQFYLVAEDGNVAQGAPANDAIHLLAFLGGCSQLGSNPRIDEVSTLAAGYALNGFISGSDNNNISGNAAALTNAIALLQVIYDLGSRQVLPGLTGAGNTETKQKINSLANSLAECVNSSDSSSSQCLLLKQCTTPGAAYNAGTNTCSGGSGVPTDTLAAVLSVVRYTGQISADGLYKVAGINGVFVPALTVAPQNWLMSVSYAVGLNTPMNVAIDSAGNAWVVNSGDNTLSVFNVEGLINTTSSGLSGLNNPLFLAIDSNNQIFVSNNGTAADCTGGSVSGFYLNTTTTAVAALAGQSQWGVGNICRAWGIGATNHGTLWLAAWNTVNGSGTRFHLINYLSSTNGGLAPNSDNYFTRAAWGPVGVVVDSNDFAWIAEQTGNSSGYSAIAFWKYDTATQTYSYTNSMYTMNTPTFPSNNPNPYNIVIGPNGNKWFTNVGDKRVAKTQVTPPSGTQTTTVYTAPGITTPVGITVDAGGNVWVSGGAGDGVIVKLDNNGNALSPAAGFQITGIAGGDAEAIAVDANGNLWVPNAATNTLSILVSAASPTRTPLSSAIRSGFTP